MRSVDMQIWPEFEGAEGDAATAASSRSASSRTSSRGLAAELQHRRLQMRGAELCDDPPDMGRAGEVDPLRTA
jgi:hypothetical protein